MKMLNAIIAATLLVGSSALAETQDEEHVFAFLSEERVQFVYQGQDQYHCDFLKAEVGAILRRMGARDIVVRCTGGLPYDRASYVDAQFISIRQTTSEKSTRKAKMMPVSVNFSKSCDLHRVMMREVIKGFDIYDYAEGGNCSPSRGNATFQFVTLF